MAAKKKPVSKKKPVKPKMEKPSIATRVRRVLWKLVPWGG